MPFVGLATGSQFEESMIVIKKGNPPPPYTTREQAKDAGAVTVNYGNFIQQIINFLLIALVLFFIIKGTFIRFSLYSRSSLLSKKKKKASLLTRFSHSFRSCRCFQAHLQGRRSHREAVWLLLQECGN